MNVDKKGKLQVDGRESLLRIVRSLDGAYGRRRALYPKKKRPCELFTPEPGNDRLHAEVGGCGILPFDWRTPEAPERWILTLPFQIQFAHLSREGEFLMGTALMGEWDTVPSCWSPTPPQDLRKIMI